MNTRKNGFRLLSALLIFALAAFVVSCNEDDSQVGYSDSQNVASEASTDSYFEDAEDLSATASLADDASLGGRVGGLDDRFCDNVKVKFQHKSDANSDTIVIDFGTGCTDPRGNVRKGKIIIVFSPGSRKQISNSVVTTFDGFSVNGVSIEGTRTVTLTSLEPPTHEITLEDGLITWPDNSTASRTAHHFRKWDNKGTLARSDDEIVILDGGTASGTNRNGKEYSMEITADIVFKASCLATKKFLPVSGEKVLSIGGKTTTVNYGTGDCDNVITVTINGESKEVTVDRG
jgi:hypothetical protein